LYREEEQMKVTPHELMKLGLWERYCDETGMSIYAVNEGLDSDAELVWDIDVIGE